MEWDGILKIGLAFFVCLSMIRLSGLLRGDGMGWDLGQLSLDCMVEIDGWDEIGWNEQIMKISKPTLSFTDSAARTTYSGGFSSMDITKASGCFFPSGIHTD